MRPEGEAEDRAEAARKLLEEGLEGDYDRRAIRQLSRTFVAYHYEVPANARFESGAFFSERSGGIASATFRVTLTPDGGEPEVLCEADVPFREERRLSADLSAHAGRVCRLQLEVLAAGDAPDPVVGAWVSPGVTGDSAPTPDPASPGLAELRETLAGVHHSPSGSCSSKSRAAELMQ